MKKSQPSSVRAKAKSGLPLSIVALVVTLSSVSTALPVNQLVATVQLGFNLFPSAVVVSPDSKTVYVVSSGTSGGVLSIIDTQTDTVTDTIPVPGAEDSMVISPDGSTLYIGNQGTVNPPTQTSVTVISTATKTITATVDMSAVGDLAISPDGKALYITVPDGISIIDTVTNTLIPNAINVGGIDENIAVSRDGKSAYVNLAGGNVLAIDLGTKQVVATIPLAPTNDIPVYFATSPDGTKLYISTRHYVYIADTSTNTIVHTIFLPRLGSKHGIDGKTGITPDGKFLYEPYSVENTIVMVDTGTKKAAGTQISVGYPQAVAVAPTANFAYSIGDVTTGNGQEGELYVINIFPE